MLKISEELEQMSASGDFGVALDGLHERVAALEIELDDLRTELDAALRQWNEIVLASGSKTHGGAIGHVAAMRAELGSLRAELEAAKENHRIHAARLISEKILVSEHLEAARKQEPCGWQCRFITPTETWGYCSKEHYETVKAAPHEHPGYEVRAVYARPVPPPANQEPCGYMCEDAGITTIYNAAKCTGDFSKHTPVYKSPVPAQQAESPWQVINNENWNIPKLGQRVILFSNGVIQNDSYTLDRGDDGYFWSRDDVDECPEVKAGDAWMPWPDQRPEFAGGG